jgi:hypothetical protein
MPLAWSPQLDVVEVAYGGNARSVGLYWASDPSVQVRAGWLAGWLVLARWLAGRTLRPECYATAQRSAALLLLESAWKLHIH